MTPPPSLHNISLDARSMHSLHGATSPPPPSTQDLLTALHTRYRAMFDTLTTGYTRMLATEEAYISRQESRISTLRERVRDLESALAAAEQTASENAAALSAARQLVGLGIVVPGDEKRGRVGEMMQQPSQIMQYRKGGNGFEFVTVADHGHQRGRSLDRRSMQLDEKRKTLEIETFNLDLCNHGDQPPAVPPKSGARQIPPVPPLPKEYELSSPPPALSRSSSSTATSTAVGSSSGSRDGGDREKDLVNNWMQGTNGVGEIDVNVLGGYNGAYSQYPIAMDAGCGKSVSGRSGKSLRLGRKGAAVLGRIWRRSGANNTIKV